jgi:hypothetical protein
LVEDGRRKMMPSESFLFCRGYLHIRKAKNHVMKIVFFELHKRKENRERRLRGRVLLGWIIRIMRREANGNYKRGERGKKAGKSQRPEGSEESEREKTEGPVLLGGSSA